MTDEYFVIMEMTTETEIQIRFLVEGGKWRKRADEIFADIYDGPMRKQIMDFILSTTTSKINELNKQDKYKNELGFLLMAIDTDCFDGSNPPFKDDSVDQLEPFDELDGMSGSPKCDLWDIERHPWLAR